MNIMMPDKPGRRPTSRLLLMLGATVLGAFLMFRWIKAEEARQAREAERSAIYGWQQ